MTSPSPRHRVIAWGVSATALLAAGAAQAQPAAPLPPSAPAAAETGYEVDELVVTSSRGQPGSVIGDIPPEIQLSPRDIRAYGVSSVSELVTALAPQTTSGRGSGPPVMLVNGQRITSFTEIRDLPTEAIMRVDILPEEVSLKYGYRADQRVINLVLRPRFRATTLQGSVRTPTQGNGEVYGAQANILRIQRQNRLMVDAKVSRTTAILERQRDFADTRADRAYRSLTPDSRSASLNAVLSRPLAEGVAATFNASLEGSRDESLLGLPAGVIPTPQPAFTLPPPQALERASDSVAAHAGVGLNGAVSGWTWSFSGNADLNDTWTTTQRVVGGLAYTDKSHAISKSADAEGVLAGTVLQLPAGAATTSVKVGASTLNLDTTSLRAGVARQAVLSRDKGALQASFDLPVASRSKGVLSGLGDLSFNVNAALDHLSDFGELTTLGGGVNWAPVKPLRLIASFTQEEGAPTVQQIGAPEQVTPGVRVFDFARGETVEVSRVEGGARGLRADSRKVMKVGVTLKPFDATDLTVTANYVRTRIDDVIAAFPTASPQIEAAFPNRFVRDASGRLLQIDSRPVNFDHRDTEEIRWGFTFRKRLGPIPPQGGPGRMAGNPDGPPPGGGGPRERGAGGAGGFRGGGFGPGAGGFGGGNLQIGLFHTLYLRDEISIRPGVPALDLLDGGAIGNGGGQPRHQVDLQGNIFKNGYGLSLNGRWQSATKVSGSALGDLRFSDLATLNLRLFADLGAQPNVWRTNPWLRGARLTLSIDNVFDAQQKVTTPAGLTPITFQPDYLDPQGRTVRLSFRKVFFPIPPAMSQQRR